MTIVFYISGHGFGHASRDIEVIDTILKREPDARIVVRTSVARNLFDLSVSRPIELQTVETDSGVVQIDSLRLNEDETARRAASFYGGFERRVAEEATILRDLHASLVVGDIPPLAFAAAERAGVPSIALANFTWDWIYSGFPQFERLAPGVIELMAGAYARASCALRMPLHGGFAPMMRVTRDVPFIARCSRYSRAAARQALGLDTTDPVVLASFGGHGMSLPYQEIARRNDFVLAITDHELPVERDDIARLKRFNMRELAHRGLRYQDLVAASDVVVTKPGYGIVSECIANQTAIAYTSRGQFLEYDVMVAGMPSLLRCRYISHDDLLAGRWTGTIHKLLEQDPPLEHAVTSGADIAAEEILSRSA